MKLFLKWLYTDAPWWMFWMPQSGYEGGAIAGMVIWLVVYLVFY